MQRIYLDNNATTAVLPAVFEAMRPFFTERFGNPSSAHGFGEDAALALRQARTDVAALVGARSPREIVFTSGGTESINTALRSAWSTRGSRAKIVTSAIEHSAVLEPLQSLESDGARVVRIGVDAHGRLERDALLAALDGDVALVSLMAANNEIGVVQDLEPIAQRCRELEIPVHVDAVQAAGKLPLDVARLGVDFASFSAHKIHGPKGVGALYVRGGATLAPLLFGGPQEARRRPGTENVPGIVGFARAAALAREFVASPAHVQLKALRDRLEDGLAAALPGTRIHGRDAPRLPNTTNVSFEGLEAEALLAMLSAAGLFVSAGSACHAQARQPSHVLLALGLTPAEAASSLRFSLARTTTADEIERALAITVESAKSLQALA